MGKRILNYQIEYNCPEFCNGLLEQLLFQPDCLELCLWTVAFRTILTNSVLLEKYQSRLNQSFKHNSAGMPSLNSTPNFSFGPRICLLIIKGYYTKSKRFQSLDFLFYLSSLDFLLSFIITLSSSKSPFQKAVSSYLQKLFAFSSSYLFPLERSRKISSSILQDTYSFKGSRNNKLSQFQPFLE